MNVLVVGGGGREHALVWKIAASPLVRRLVCAPGNPGIARLAETRPIAAADVHGQLALARDIAADLVVIGPETAIAAGLGDVLRAGGIACFGPSAAAGRIESSKAFAKDLALRHGLPAPRFSVFDSLAPARAALAGFAAPYVIKADGLAAGKGVAIAGDRIEAEAAIEAAFAGRFGAAGARVLLEEHVAGEIASLFALSDGRDFVLFGGAQDHKRALDGDQGANTGGMGAYAPAPILDEATVASTRDRLIAPALAALADEGAPFVGALFCEVMVTADGPKLIEFNARFGDPECQVLMLRLADDILPYLLAAATGGLARLPPPRWRDEAAVCVVLAARGYPEAPVAGGVIDGAETNYGSDVTIFHAGTARRADGALLGAGGRVLNVCARAPTLRAARDRAYAVVDQNPLSRWLSSPGHRRRGAAAGGLAVTVPAEWAAHRAMWLGWPSHPDLWEANLESARAEIAALTEALAGPGRERVRVLAAGEASVSSASARLGGVGGVEIVAGDFGDIWLRDTGPIFTAANRAEAFAFNGWGGKYRLPGDELVAGLIAERSSARLRVHRCVLEGGALDHDGEGSILTTRQCLLNANRNPGWGETEAEAALATALGSRRVIWLDEGLANDHTDGHVDNLARFVAPGHVVCPVAFGDDDPNRAVYDAAAGRLAGAGLAVTRIASPGRVEDENGHAAPASHLNFIIANHAVIVPTYGDPTAPLALAALEPLFPGRVVIGLPSNALLSGGGSFHCISQQVPAG